MNTLNEIFDHIFVITIPTFSERVENMKHRLQGVEFEFFYGAYGRDIDTQKYRDAGSGLTRGQMACALSHIKLYEKMIDENLHNTLILEDDCMFVNTTHLQACRDELPKDYSVFWLGYGECSSFTHFSDHLFQLTHGNISHTHAMSVSLDYAAKVIEMNKNLCWTADGVYTEILRTTDKPYFLANPVIAIQDNNGSTSTLAVVDREYGRL